MHCARVESAKWFRNIKIEQTISMNISNRYFSPRPRRTSTLLDNRLLLHQQQPHVLIQWSVCNRERVRCSFFYQTTETRCVHLVFPPERTTVICENNFPTIQFRSFNSNDCPIEFCLLSSIKFVSVIKWLDRHAEYKQRDQCETSRICQRHRFDVWRGWKCDDDEQRKMLSFNFN